VPSLKILKTDYMLNDISLIGIGYIGKIHLKLLKENTNWNLIGIYDTDQELCQKFATQYGIKAFKSLQEALENSQVIDIATPSSTHFEIATTAIASGKHVFVEKPVTSNIEDARILQSLVKEAAVVLQVGHVERFNPAFIAAQPYIKNPVFIEVHRLAQYNPRGTDVSVVLDLTMHDLDLIVSIVDSKVKHIHVAGTSLVSANADIVNIRLEFENGCVANLTTNRVSLRNSRKFRVFTNQNLVNINLLDKTTEVVRIREAQEGTKNMVLDPGPGLSKKEIIFEHPVILPTNAINEELITFHKSINSGKANQVSIEDAIRTLEVAFAIEERLKQNAV
jgi:predicted dehydrogenase